MADGVQTTYFVGNCAGNMSRSPGGYFAHASSDKTHCSLWWRSPQGAPTDITEDPAYWKHSEGCPGSMLDGYLVPLPAPLTPPIPQNFESLLKTSG
jgi:hypothetical protein